LELNVDARNRGRIRVELVDEDERPIPDFSGDASEWMSNVNSVRFRYPWKDGYDLSRLSGRVVRLRVEIQDAAFYSFRLTPQSS
jgi:hypothetical protein